jgi:hypothetical protein
MKGRSCSRRKLARNKRGRPTKEEVKKMKKNPKTKCD